MLISIGQTEAMSFNIAEYNMVIMKNSSPQLTGRQLAVCGLFVGQLSADCRSFVGQLLAVCWPTVYRQFAKAFVKNVSQLLVICR